MNFKTTAFGSVVAGDSGKEKLLHDLNTVVDDAQALLKEVAHSSAENVVGVPAYLEDRFGKLKSNLQRARSVVESKAKDVSVETDTYVHESPWKSMGFASAASLCLGLLLAGSLISGFGKTRKGWK